MRMVGVCLRRRWVGAFSGLVVVSAALSSPAWAAAPKWGAPEPEVRACVERAAEAFEVESIVIWTLLDVESGTVGKVSRNTNGTVDIGPMQINSIHLPRLEKLGVTLEQLRDNLCTNINVGTWIFKQEYARTKNIAQAVASYHSRTPRHQARYLGLAVAALERRIARAKAEEAATPPPLPPPAKPLVVPRPSTLRVIARAE
jgi:soluble lytic murein transglycosylase-like protein